MRVFSFKTAGHIATTPEKDGGNLPTHLGPWMYLKETNIERGDGPRIVRSSEELLDAIEKDGFHIMEWNVTFA